jgi:sulfite reductase alpha subunit-like flavoprotein
MDKATHEKIVAEITAERFPFPVPTTYRKVLETYIDLTARPSPELLLALSEHASDPDFRATFESYGSDGGLYDTEIAQRQVRVGKMLTFFTGIFDLWGISYWNILNGWIFLRRSY